MLFVQTGNVDVQVGDKITLSINNTKFTIFHIMNTINMGVAAKMKEYGSMRAIEMSNRQLIKMIIAEAGTYAISRVIWSCIIGLPMHWVIWNHLLSWQFQNCSLFFSLQIRKKISLYTSFVCDALTSHFLIRKGRKSLEAINEIHLLYQFQHILYIRL